MTRNHIANDVEAMRQRMFDYLRAGELAAYYMSGLADGIEAMGGADDDSLVKGAVYHLRSHSKTLNTGTLWVEFGHEPAQPGKDAS